MRIIFLLMFGLVTTANAAVVTYTDRPTWEAAAGTPDIVEDFEGFAVDTEFRTAPVATAFGTIVQSGTDLAFRNEIDVVPLVFTDNNGTNHASCFVNGPDGGPGTETEVVLNFSAPLSSWGADFTGATGSEILVIVIDGGGQTSMLVPDNNATAFVGINVTSGAGITSIILRAQNVIPGGAGEGFGMDNVAIGFASAGFGEPKAIPVLQPFGLAILIMLLILFSRRKFAH